MAQPERKVDTDKRPIWSWEAGIFANLGEIGKWIDDNAMKCESGDMSYLFEWKAALRQFYRNIKSLLTESIRQIAEKSFEEIDSIIPMPSKTLPSSKEEIKKIMIILGNLNDMLYHARNELLIKVIEKRNVDDELRDYMRPPEARDRGVSSSQP